MLQKKEKSVLRCRRRVAAGRGGLAHQAPLHPPFQTDLSQAVRRLSATYISACLSVLGHLLRYLR